MPDLAELMDKMKGVEAEIEAELSRRREELRFRFEQRRIVFEENIEKLQRTIKVGASKYLFSANPLIVLSAPVIYSLIVPFVLADL